MSQAEIPAAILAMPIAERIDLVARIWDSIAADAAIAIGVEDRDVLCQRLADHQKHPDRGVSWDVLKKQLGERQ